MNEQTNTNFLKNEEYADASHLQIRQRLTEEHRVQGPGWFTWLYERLDLPMQILNEIAHFFRHYKDLESKQVEDKGWASLEPALERIKYAQKLYAEAKVSSQ
jgi:hypothetical protein